MATLGLLNGLAVGQGSCLSGEIPADSANRKFTGEHAEDGLGYAVGGIGSVDAYPATNEAVIVTWFFDGHNNSKLYVVRDTLAPLYQYLHGGLAVSVAPTGDLNNDLVPDFIVGGTPTRVYSGANGSTIVSFQAEQPGDGFGHSVAGVGDFDGNGRPDVAVGAPFNTLGGVFPGPNGEAGRVYVFLTPDNGYAQPASDIPAGEAKVIFTGNPGDWLGYDIAGKRVNDDNAPDLIMGAPYARNVPTSSGNGKLYVFFVCPCLVPLVCAQGESCPQTEWGAATAELDDAVHVVIEMVEQNAYFAWAVDGGGDFNGGGKPDLLVGSYRWVEQGVVPPGAPPSTICGPGTAWTKQTGKVWIYYGEDYSFPACNCPPPAPPPNNTTLFIDSEVARVQITGREDAICLDEGSGEGSVSFGWDVAYAGRVNADGYDDILVGAPYYDEGLNACAPCPPFSPPYCSPPCPPVDNYFALKVDSGAAYLFWGTNAYNTSTPQLNSDDHAAVQFEGMSAGDWFGYSVDGHGFANRDTREDIIIGAPRVDSGGLNNRGRAYVFFPCP